MAPTATVLAYDPEPPCNKLERLLGLKIIDSARKRPDLWPKDQKQIVIACIKHLASGISSPDAQRHSDDNRMRYIRLDKVQNDILFCAYLEIEFEHPDIVELTKTSCALYEELERINTLR